METWAMAAKPRKRHLLPSRKLPSLLSRRLNSAKCRKRWACTSRSNYTSLRAGTESSSASWRASLCKRHIQRKALVLGRSGREHSWYKDQKTEDHNVLCATILINIQPRNLGKLDGVYYKWAHHRWIFKYEEHLKLSTSQKHARLMRKNRWWWDMGFSFSSWWCMARLENYSLLSKGNKIEKRGSH